MEEEIPITLYLGLEQGRHPDLAVVSRTALAFAQLVEEMAYILDPSATVRIEIVSGTEGSFGLNTVSRVFVKVSEGIKKGVKKHPKSSGWPSMSPFAS